MSTLDFSLKACFHLLFLSRIFLSQDLFCLPSFVLSQVYSLSSPLYFLIHSHVSWSWSMYFHSLTIVYFDVSTRQLQKFTKGFPIDSGRIFIPAQVPKHRQYILSSKMELFEKVLPRNEVCSFACDLQVNCLINRHL